MPVQTQIPRLPHLAHRPLAQTSDQQVPTRQFLTGPHPAPLSARVGHRAQTFERRPGFPNLHTGAPEGRIPCEEGGTRKDE
ncbi:hypothetical protein GCM10009527_028600 [Actinomadura nitritigenes]